MKAYKFRFENVLKSKKIVVDELVSKTARARKILMLEQKKLEDLKGRRAWCVQELAERQVGRVDATEVQRCYRYLQQLVAAVVHQDRLVLEISRRVEKLREMLVEAEKQRKIFEKLDEHEREEFLRSYSRKEQQLLDEIGINRFLQREALSKTQSPRPA